MRQGTRLALFILISSLLLLVCKVYFVRETCNSIKSVDKARHRHFTQTTKLDVPQTRVLIDGAHAEEATAASKNPANVSADTSDFFLEGPLPVAFKHVLEKYPIVPIADVKIVLIIAYYRSGSSFFGELMSSTPRTFFHYEPLMLFTVAGGIRPGRQHHAFQLLDALVRCRFEPLYTAWMESTAYYKHNHFLADICGGGESCFSPGHLTGLCSRAQTQVFKFTRLSVAQVQSWIQQNPEIAPSVRVIHLVRDPRAMYASRRRLDWCRNDKHCGSAAALCGQVRSDLDAFGELGRHLPSNRIYQMRFEDLAADPLNETRRLFTTLGLDFAPSVSDYVGNHTTATGAKTKDEFSTWRNAKEVADRWRRRLPLGTIRAIETTCNDVILRLGYRLP
uniref:Protein containing Sulfotransfer 1 domain n=1 Tax=Rhipicephalus zambeziensis TaxID=60191 RepID=A0A224YRV1_9ACAR